jgi:SAM-dependent methyltransferase
MLDKEISLGKYIQAIKIICGDINDQFEDDLLDLVRFYQGKSERNPIQGLMNRWTASLDDKPDYSIYSDKRYLMDAWACWHIYSKGYINNLAKKMPLINESYSVLDLGCGPGLTTAHLKNCFPDIRIGATQIKNTDQWNMAAYYSGIFNFELFENTEKAGKFNIVFASEYFEHFENPIEHLEQVLNDTQPFMLITANSFNTVGLGHFKKYKNNDSVIDEKDISRAFNKKLKSLGYNKFDHDVKFWNNRPAIWAKE